MFLLAQLLIGFCGVAALAAFLSAFCWVLLALLVVRAAFGIRTHLQIRRYEADVQAGRVQPIRVERCQECSELMMPCDACVQRCKAAKAA